MSFRKEKKFRLSKFDFELLKNKLRNEGMKSLYSKRTINSLYYDTELYSMFKDSEEGLLPRRKVRFRWYDNVKMVNHETKISSLEGRFKTSYHTKIESKSTLPSTLFDSYYGTIYPSLFVSYTREYFFLGLMRITFDSKIYYTNHRQTRSILHKDKECVMEIKVGLEIQDDYIESMIPVPTARFSKYSRGLLISNNDL
jgi:hypothetical protein